MRTPRIYQPGPLPDKSELILDSNATRHVANVLRLRNGEQLTIFDGNGGEHPATISRISKREVAVTLSDRIDREVESSLQITLAQGISKGDRMDFAIQKSVELGVSRIIPVHTSRSVVSLKGERLEKKMRHWEGVVISACEQCGRNTLPMLERPQSLEEVLNQEQAGTRLLLDHRAERGFSALDKAGKLTLLIGPEGGLSDVERQSALRCGYQAIRMGPRVLRTETAALAALSILQATMGDLC